MGFGLLLLRVVLGLTLAAHGAQKLFGWFGGSGLEGTAGWLESLHLRPATAWARIAGGSEFGGGLLTALGFLNPLGPIAAMGAMSVAWAKVHLGNPVWGTKGGAELPLTNIAVLSALTLAGPGKLSIDSMLGIRVPRLIGLTALLGMLAAVFVTSRQEIVAGTSMPAAGGADVEGDPSPAPDAQAEIVQSADASRIPMGSDAFDDQPAIGLSGADAGTSMGTGSALGSETPETV